MPFTDPHELGSVQEAHDLIRSAYEAICCDAEDADSEIKVQAALASCFVDLVYNTEMPRFRSFPELCLYRKEPIEVIAPIYAVREFREREFEMLDEFPDEIDDASVQRILALEGAYDRFCVWHSVLSVMTVINDIQRGYCQINLERVMEWAHELYLLTSESGQPERVNQRKVSIATLEDMLDTVKAAFAKEVVVG